MALAEIPIGTALGGAQMMAARCGQEVTWHERMEGLPKEDLVEELLECMTHPCDQVERKPSGVIHKGVIGSDEKG